MLAYIYLWILIVAGSTDIEKPEMGDIFRRRRGRGRGLQAGCRDVFEVRQLQQGPPAGGPVGGAEPGGGGCPVGRPGTSGAWMQSARRRNSRSRELQERR